LISPPELSCRETARALPEQKRPKTGRMGVYYDRRRLEGLRAEPGAPRRYVASCIFPYRRERSMTQVKSGDTVAIQLLLYVA